MHFLYQATRDVDMRKLLRIKNLLALMLVAIFFLIDIYPKLWRIGMLIQQRQMVPHQRSELTPAQQKEQEGRLQVELQEVMAQTQFLRQRWQELREKAQGQRDTAQITLEIEDLAAAAKVELVSIKPGEIFLKNRYEVLPAEIKFRGDYAQLIDFLGKTEQAAALMSVQKATLRKNSEVSPQLEGILKFNFLFSTANGPRTGVQNPKKEK